ncbi:hypothetical protein TomMM35A_18630 [Sphingobium sp. TomMM35A]
MRGRAKGNQERIIVLAHQIEIMARQKSLRPVKHYLPKSQEATKRNGASAVLAMMKRMQEQQSGAKP